MNERQIQRALYWSRNGSSLMQLPNYTPQGWYECDLWYVTKARYFYEFEIKLTLSDLRADGRKGGGWRWDYSMGTGYKKHRRALKHDDIANATPKSPRCFWYVVPPSLAEFLFPEWAGVIVAHDVGRRIILKGKRAAPKRHAHKVEQSVIDHARSVCYHRYWSEIVRSGQIIEGMQRERQATAT